MNLHALALAMGALSDPSFKTLQILGLAEDSRLVKKGDLFFCVKGFKQDGSVFAVDAVNRGAVAIVVEGKPLRSVNVPQVVVRDMRKALSLGAHAFYKDPSRRVKVIGVTGTKGKTTVTYLLRSILRAGGQKVGLIGTIAYEVGNKVIEAPNTTPSALTVARLLDEMSRAGCRWCVMEVSSHALDQDRVLGVKFVAALFTNLGLDHLDYHKTFASYFSAKKRLFNDFKSVKVRVTNADDPYGRRLLKDRRVRSYGIQHKSDYQALQIWVSPERLKFLVKDMEITAPLTGVFNVYNVLAAVAVLKELGFSTKTLEKGVAGAQAVPGRFEAIRSGQDFTVLVDYAHTPNALEAALTTAKELAGEARLISLFGCGGDRDPRKRPVMGEISSRLADLTVITSDNPRSEDPSSILEQIVRGIPKRSIRNGHERVFVQQDRAKAIRLALSKAGTGDVVLIAGKGHETYQIVGGKKTHFDDREEARKALKTMRVTKPMGSVR